MRIFLLGSTGATGYEILKRLVAENHSVPLLVRNPSGLSLRELSAKEGQVTIIAGEVRESEKLVQHFKGCDAITDNFFMNRIIRPNYNKAYYDQTRWETVLDETRDIDWTCVRPPKLINKPFTGKYRTNLNHCPKGGWKISRADLADFVVKQLTSDEYIRRKPVVAY